MKHISFRNSIAFFLSIIIAANVLFCVPLLSFAADPETAQAAFTNEYVDPKKKLEVAYTAPVGTSVSYRWYVDNKLISTTKKNSFDVQSAYKGKMIRCEVWSKTAKLSSCEMFYSDLPVVYLNTENSAPIASKSEYVNANVKISGNRLFNSENTTLYDGACTVKGHGNSTWQHFDKKAYKIKLDKKTDLFGMGKNKSWLLIANYIDETAMRNKLSCYYAKMIGTTAMDSKWVDVVINGEYMGLYDLYEQVKISKDRVNIFDWEDAAGEVAKAIAKAENFTEEQEDALGEAMETNLAWITSDTVSFLGKKYTVSEYYKKLPATADGGYLMELDRNFDEISQFKTNRDIPIMFKSPEYLNTNEKMFSEIEQYVKEMEDTFYSKDNTIVKDGKTLSFADYCDPESLVNFWLASEFMKNEIGWSSSYLHKQVGKRITFGPVWDFDFSSNNVAPFGGTGARSWITKTRAWFSEIMKNPYFAVKARELYMEKESGIAEALKEGGMLEEWYQYIKASALRNEQLWKYSRGFEKDYQVLKEFIADRLEWVGNEFLSDDSALLSLGGSFSDDITLTLQADGVTDLGEKAFCSGSDALEKVTLYIDCADTSLSRVNVYLNARFVCEAALENGKASVDIDAAAFNEASGKKNVISVWCKDAAGNLQKQQYCSMRLGVKEPLYSVSFHDEEAVNTYSIVSGDSIRLPQPEKEDKLFEGWKAEEQSYPGGTALTPDRSCNFSAVYAPCSDGTLHHSFVLSGDVYTCSVCAKQKADRGKYVDVSDIFYTVNGKYSFSYTGEPVCPDVIAEYGGRRLQAGVDYTISFRDNIDIGYATYEVKGIKQAGFSGSVELSYRIVPVNIGYKTVEYSLQNPAECYYTGKALTPKIKIVYLGKTLQEGKDYRVEYSQNVKPGKGIAKVYGLGNFSKYDTPKVYRFTIAKGDIGKLVPKLAFTAKPYTGKAMKPAVVFPASVKLKAGVDYTVKYENNVKIGRAKVTVTGKGNYMGKAVRYFTIGPKATAITSLSSPAKNQIKVSYKRPTTSLTGYQIIYSDRKDFKKYITVNVKGYYNTSKVIHLAKHYPTLYVRVRAYKTLNGVRCFNSFSPVKTVKVKSK